MTDLTTGTDGITRCGWASGDPEYERYHDEEWATPLHDERRLFEKLCLEGFQAGLSWITILRKRDAFRAAFAGFEPDAVARFDIIAFMLCCTTDWNAFSPSSANASPIASQPCVVGSSRGRSGTSASAAASAAARPAEAFPTVPFAPKHPHGAPVRPAAIAAT